MMLEFLTDRLWFDSLIWFITILIGALPIWDQHLLLLFVKKPIRNNSNVFFDGRELIIFSIGLVIGHIILLSSTLFSQYGVIANSVRIFLISILAISLLVRGAIRFTDLTAKESILDEERIVNGSIIIFTISIILCYVAFILTR